jgi:hypothetical protein
MYYNYNSVPSLLIELLRSGQFLGGVAHVCR